MIFTQVNADTSYLMKYLHISISFLEPNLDT